jgi:hypothetical protein
MLSATVVTGASVLMAAQTRRDRALVASQPHSSISTPTAISTRAVASSNWSGSETVTIHHTRARPPIRAAMSVE